MKGQNPEKPETPKELPYRKLADQLWSGFNRAEHMVDYHKLWFKAFKAMLQKYSFEDLSGCLTWLFEVDDFWVQTYLTKVACKGKKDPLAWLLQKKQWDDPFHRNLWPTEYTD